MKRHATLTLLTAALLMGPVRPTYGVSKEILQMMQQLDTLQQAVQNMQKTLDTQTAVLKTLIEQANDNVSTMKVNVGDIQKTTEQNLASANARMDSLTSQIQSLGASLDEAKARLGKLSEQMTQTQNMIQTLNTPPASNPATAPPAPGGNAKPTTSLPDPDTLYNSGLSYYNGGQYELATQAFQDYLKYYGDTDRASNAQFYIGDCFYNQGNYSQAVAEYNKCLERYRGGNKEAAAQLKKGFALQEMGQPHAAIKELRSLVERFPHAHEAELARQRLKKLGITVSR